MQKTILIIGSGRRVRQTLLPAVLCLKKYFRLIGVLATSRQTVIDQSPFESIQTITTLDSVDLHTVDIIMIAVTTEQVPNVLQTLRSHDTRHIVLFMDTPVVRMRHIFALRYLRFRSVYVTEDYWSNPKFTLIHDMMRDGEVGNIRSIYFMHNAYKHHGIAMIKRISSTGTILWARKQTVSRGVSVVRLRLENGVSGTIYEPRDYTVGRLLVAADNGFISDYPLSDDNGTTLTYDLNGFTVTHNKKIIKRISYRYAQIVRRNVPSATMLTVEKVEGVIRMLESVRRKQATHLYSLSCGLYDMIVAASVDKYGFFVDCPIPIIRKSLVSCCIEGLVWGLTHSKSIIKQLHN